MDVLNLIQEFRICTTNKLEIDGFSILTQTHRLSIGLEGALHCL
jgi:hypothetical protein